MKSTREIYAGARAAMAGGEYEKSLELVEELVRAVENKYGMEEGGLSGKGSNGVPTIGRKATAGGRGNRDGAGDGDGDGDGAGDGDVAGIVFVLVQLGLARFGTGDMGGARAAVWRAERVASAGTSSALPPRVVAGLLLAQALITHAEGGRGSEEEVARLLASGMGLMGAAEGKDSLGMVPFLVNSVLLGDLPAMMTVEGEGEGESDDSRGARKRAVAVLATVLRVLGSVFEPNGGAVADVHLLAGVVAATGGDGARAEEHYQRAVEEAGRVGRAATRRAGVFNKGLLALERGDTGSAFAAFRSIRAELKGSSDDPQAALEGADAALQMALILIEAGRREKGSLLLAQVVETRTQVLGSDHVLTQEAVGFWELVLAEGEDAAAARHDLVAETIDVYRPVYGS